MEELWMERSRQLKFLLPIIIVLIAVISLVILTGLASENPDGFEWALFGFAGVEEPEGGFAGIWSFLGEGPLVDVLTGSIGIIVVLVIGYIFFRVTSRKSE
jgi:hypothetical protein